jgi:hypothetical protein
MTKARTELEERCLETRAFGIEKADVKKREKAVKPLKTSDPVNCRFRHLNDFKNLRPALRNVSFRMANIRFAFAAFEPQSGGSKEVWNRPRNPSR